jgi:hypothetical protein
VTDETLETAQAVSGQRMKRQVLLAEFDTGLFDATAAIQDTAPEHGFRKRIEARQQRVYPGCLRYGAGFEEQEESAVRQSGGQVQRRERRAHCGSLHQVVARQRTVGDDCKVATSASVNDDDELIRH